jgi:hypothetical protein
VHPCIAGKILGFFLVFRDYFVRFHCIPAICIA